MRILVTGGAGFIASHVVDRFLADGHEVAIVDNFCTGRRDNLNPKAALYEADIRDRKALTRVFADFQPEAIDHHAAHIDVRKSVEDPVFDAGSNILGAINLLELAREGGAKKFIFISSGGAVYGEPETFPVKETQVPAPLCPYGASKQCGEIYVGLYHRLHGLDYTVLRYPNIYGPRQDPKGEAGVVAIFHHQMLTGQTPTIFGDGSKTRDYLFVGDAVRANALALEPGEKTRGVFNLGWGRQVSDFEIFDGVRRALGLNLEPNYADQRPGEIEHICLDATRAREILGWQPEVALDDGLARCAEYYRQVVTG